MFNKLINAITLRDYYENKYRQIYNQEYLNNVEEYLNNNKLNVMKTDSLKIEGSTVEHTLIIADHASITNSVMYGSRVASAKKS